MQHPNPLPPVLRRFVRGSALFTVLCGATEIFCKLVLHLRFPYTFPLVDPGTLTQDILLHVRTFRHLHQRDFFNQAGFFYPVPAAVPYALILLSPIHARLTYYSVSAVILLIASLALRRALTRQGLAAPTTAGLLASSLLLSYPFWFLLKQGNIELSSSPSWPSASGPFCADTAGEPQPPRGSRLHEATPSFISTSPGRFSRCSPWRPSARAVTFPASLPPFSVSRSCALRRQSSSSMQPRSKAESKPLPSWRCSLLG